MLVCRIINFALALILLAGGIIACTRPALTRPAEPARQVSIPADNPGAVDALNQLRDILKEGISLSSRSDEQLDGQRRALIGKLDGVTKQVEEGRYQDALDALDGDFKLLPADLVVSSHQSRAADAIKMAVDSIISAAKTTITTRYGKLAGTVGRGITYTWKGVPFSAPPVGDLRWRAPRDPAPWQGVRHSTESYNQAMQLNMGKTWIPTGTIGGSEDCLYLNVWRPMNEDKNLPVYVWIHGGGNNFGSAKLYDEARLAATSSMVVVVIQYRLGPLGWFNHPALKSGVTLEEASGNFGTLDTIQALKWVKENIAAFGGNPDNVTVAGQSAGGHNVMNLVISPLAGRLFHRAIAQSGGMTVQTVDKGMEMANATIDKLLLADGKAPDMSAAKAMRTTMSNREIAQYLRSQSAEQLIKAQTNERGHMDFHPAYVDGVVLPGNWQAVIESGNYNKVPLILGSNSDEMKNFLPLFGGVVPTSNGHHWFDLYQVLDGKMALDEVMPLKFDKDLYEACGYYSSRNFKARFVDSNARLLREKQDSVYCYLFKWGSPGSGPSPYDFIFGAAHAVELAFFFGWPRDSFGYAFTDQNKAGRDELQKAMMIYIRQFALTGNPNAAGGNLPAWGQWSNAADGPKCIVFDATFNEAKIGMMTEEVTASAVKGQVDGLSDPTRALVRLWLQ
jgi:para-nitrobenzyl esterase